MNSKHSVPVHLDSTRLKPSDWQEGCVARKPTSGAGDAVGWNDPSRLPPGIDTSVGDW